MKKMLWRKLICSAICWILAATPAHAIEPCEKQLAAAADALTARELQVGDYKELVTKQKAYIAELKGQRGEAVELAKDKSTPWVSREMLFVLGVLLGAAATAGVVRSTR